MLVIFDLDGTLSNSRAAIVATFAQCFTRAALPPPPEEDVVALIGLPLEVMFPRLLPAGVDPVPLTDDFRASYLDNDAQHTALFSGAVQALDALRAAGAELAVATSKSQKGAENSVQRLGIADRFEMVIGHTAVPRGKPHPDMLHHILDRLRRPVSEATMVGDTTFDLKMAQSAGVRGLGVSWGAHTPEALGAYGKVVTDFPALLSALF